MGINTEQVAKDILKDISYWQLSKAAMLVALILIAAIVGGFIYGVTEGTKQTVISINGKYNCYDKAYDNLITGQNGQIPTDPNAQERERIYNQTHSFLDNFIHNHYWWYFGIALMIMLLIRFVPFGIKWLRLKKLDKKLEKTEEKENA